MLEIDRRHFLKAAGLGFAATLAPRQVAAAQEGDALIASAVQKPDGSHGAVLLNEKAQLVHQIDLPARGHDVVVNPVKRQAVVFARRPGNFAAIFPTDGRVEPMFIAAPEGRHFYGHGCFSPDGKLLYATENDFENARGVIGVYDATEQFNRLGEFASGGIGPHELLLMGDGKTLVVANGGIETHPDFARQKLNLATMESNISFVDMRSGHLVSKHSLPSDLSRLSLRHMCLRSSDTVIFGGQYQGTPDEPLSLIGSVSLNQPLEIWDLRPDMASRMKNYIGSMAAFNGGELVCATSPLGDVAYVLDAKKRAILNRRILPKVCGVAELAGSPALSTMDGGYEVGNGNRRQARFKFDNHLAALS